MPKLVHVDAKSAVRRALERLLNPDAELQELVCILTALGWGIVMINGWPTTSVHPAIAALNNIMPGNVWGVIIVLISIIGLVGYSSKFTPLRRIMAMAGVIGWGFVGFLVFRDYHPAAAVVIAPVMMVTSAITYWRLRRDLVDRKDEK